MNPISAFSTTDNICSITIGIEAGGYTHCGILYRTEKGSFFIHLGDPFLLNNDHLELVESKHKQYKWLPFQNLHPSKQTLIKTKCIAIAEANKTLPYGIFFNNRTSFDAKGILILGGEDFTGLTCASFVRIVLRSINLEIIDEIDWPINRKDDSKWLLAIIRIYKDYLEYIKKTIKEIDDKLIEGTAPLTFRLTLNMKKEELLSKKIILTKTISDLEKGNISDFARFRPEEVAGICYENMSNIPYKFSTNGAGGADILGKALLNKLAKFK